MGECSHQHWSQLWVFRFHSDLGPHLAPTFKVARETVILWTSAVFSPARSSFAHFSSASDLNKIQAYRNHHKKGSPDYEGRYTKHICHTCLCKWSHWQGSFYNRIKFLFRVQERKYKWRRRSCWKKYMCGVMVFNTEQSLGPSSMGLPLKEKM